MFKKKYGVVLLLIIAISSICSVSAAHVGSDTTCGIHFDVYDDSGRSEVRNVHFECTDVYYAKYTDASTPFISPVGWKYTWYSPKENLYFKDRGDWDKKRVALNKALHEKGYATIKAYFSLVWWHNTYWTSPFTVHKGDTIKVVTDSVPGEHWYNYHKADLEVFVNDEEVAHVTS
jgi:hypothetical protein